MVQRLIDIARERPGAVLGWLLVIHIAVWTIVPILVCPNLPLDLAEGIALGKEWQLGYWKHPPLPWWLVDLTYRATGLTERLKTALMALGPADSASRPSN